MFLNASRSFRISTPQLRFFFRAPSDKDVVSGYNKFFHFGLAAMTGYREEMQDRHIVTFNALEDVNNREYEEFAINTMSDDFVACFSIFDGHGGSYCATKVQLSLVRRILNEQFRKRREILKKEFEGGAMIGDRQLYEAMVKKFSWLENDQDLIDAFLETDREILADNVKSGCTATVCMIIPDQEYRKKVVQTGQLGVFQNSGPRKYELITANIGDGRALLYHKGKIQLLTRPHLPSDEDESARIEKAGGRVERNRLDGLLSLSRAFGDIWAKKQTGLSETQQKCIAVPDILRYRFEIGEFFNPDDPSFLIIGCDGLWDGLGVEEAVKKVKNYLKEQWEKDGKKQTNNLFRFNLSRLCEQMADESIQTKDNVTVVVVLFRQEM